MFLRARCRESRKHERRRKCLMSHVPQQFVSSRARRIRERNLRPAFRYLKENAMLDGKKVAILVAEGFEQVEMVEPRKALQKAGAETSLVSPADGEVQGWNHFDKADRFNVDVDLE